MGEVEEIKVKEYVRTNLGGIDKVDAIVGMIENTVHLEKTKWTDIKNIKKHSPNIIDLIEVGDIIEWWYEDNYFQGFIRDFVDKELLKHLRISKCNEDIKSIVTKEQFENMEYRLED